MEEESLWLQKKLQGETVYIGSSVPGNVPPGAQQKQSSIVISAKMSVDL